MARETRLPVIGGGVGSTIGRRGTEVTNQSLSPGSSPVRNLMMGVPTVPLDASSYVAGSEARSRMSRMGSLFAIDPGGRSGFRRRLLDRFSGDSVNIAQTRIENGAYVPITENGINNFRPEIIATMDFMPIWQPNALSFADGRLKNASPIGELLNFQYQTKQLRQETLQALITNIKNAANSDPFTRVENDFANELKAIESSLSLLNSVIQNIYTINDSLDIKNIPSNNYIVRENFVDVAIPSLRQFALSKMQYSNTQYENFSETKILLQLLFDLQNVLSNYSYNLLDFTDNDRIIDRNPSAIDKTFSLNDGFTFNILNYRSATIPINATIIYDSFNNSLPEEPDSVLKLLTYLLAKEYVVSTGLGNSNNSDIIAKYGAQDTIASVASIPLSNIFSNIIGNVGDNIFELPTGLPNSIASLFYINPGLGANNIVLPFENRFVSYDEGKTYIPGNSYFSDAIIRTDTTAWNIKPYVDYVNRFNSIYADAKSAVQRLFNFRYIKRKGIPEPVGLDAAFDSYSRTVSTLLSPTDLFQRIIENYQISFDRLDTRETTALANYAQAQYDIIDLNSRIYILRQTAELERKYIQTLEVRGESDDYIGGRRRALENIKAELEQAENALALKKERLDTAKISVKQAFIIALYNYAGNDTVLKKYLYILSILAGIWKNNSVESDFITKLTANEFKTFADLNPFFYTPVADRRGRYRSITELGLISLNKNDPAYNIGSLETVIDSYIDLVVAGYIEGVITNINNRSLTDREDPITNLFTAIVPAVQTTNIGSILKDIVKGNSEANVLIQQSINMMNALFNSTKQSNQIVHIFDNGRTKLNGLSLSTQFMFLHEIFINLAKKYSGIKIKNILPGRLSLGGRAGYYVGVAIPIDTQLVLQNAFDILKSGEPPTPGNLADPAQNTPIYADLYDIYNKLNLEFNYIRDVLGILETIRKRLSDTSDNVSTFFRQNALATFLTQSPITNLDIIKNISQLRLANLIYNDLKERVTYSDSLVTLPGGPASNVLFEGSNLIVSDAILPSEYNALVSMLSEESQTFQTIPTTDLSIDSIQRNNKIITIGIPAGFSKQLSDRVNVTQFNRQGAEGKQADIIAINIFPNDKRFGEIVLKPITYIVDLSLFTTKKDFFDLNANVGEQFTEQLITRMKVSDLENPNNIKKVGIIDINSDVRYSFLTNEQKNILFKTLIQSHLFGLYVNCLTGVKYNEDVFVSTNTDRLLHPILINPINAYITKQLNEPPTTYTTTEEILANQNYSEKVKDTYRLMTYGNLVFNINEATRRVNTPKIFDRVYHLPIYLGAMEIDLDATNATEAGRLALEKPAVQKYIVSPFWPGPLYLVTNEPDDFIIKDVFFAALTNDTGTGVGLDWERITRSPEDSGSTVSAPPSFDIARRVLGLRRV